MWEHVGTIWRYQGPGWVDGRPLAMFDFDSTLHMYRKSGPVAGVGEALVAALSRDGGRNVVIFSNRSTDKFSGLANIRGFVERVEEAGGSCDVYAAAARDRNRKPQVGAWERFLRDRDVTLTPWLRGGAFYCGDAAGRLADFSASDRNFARNIGIRFRVPEQLFGIACYVSRDDPETVRYYEEPPVPASFWDDPPLWEINQGCGRKTPVFDSRLEDFLDREYEAGEEAAWQEIVVHGTLSPEERELLIAARLKYGADKWDRHLSWNLSDELTLARSEERRARYQLVVDAVGGYDVVIMIGSPASGKSTFARAAAAAHGFEIVSQDVYKTRARTLSQMLGHLSRGARVVVDNTHPSEEARRFYREPAQRAGASTCAVWMSTPELFCQHLDGLRCDSDASGNTPLLPRMAFYKYFSGLHGEEPRDADTCPLFVVEFAFAPETPAEVFEKRYAP